MRKTEYNRILRFLRGAKQFPGGLKPFRSAIGWSICLPIKRTEEMLAMVVEPAEKACLTNSCSCMNSQSSSSPSRPWVSDMTAAGPRVSAPKCGKCVPCP